MSEFGIKAAALNLLADWKKAQEQQLTPGTRSRTLGAVCKWEKPQTSWVKMNLDAAFFEEIDCIGLGSVVRGADGQFIMAMHRRQQGLMAPREAEALCLKEALIWLKDKSFSKCNFETDSQFLA